MLIVMSSFEPAFNLRPLLALIFVISFSFPHLGHSQDQINCIYAFKVQTLAVANAGTNSTIKLMTADKEGNHVEIPDLVAWSKWPHKPDDYIYFQSASLETFHGYGKCLTSEPCYLSLVASGTGDVPTWGADTVEVYTRPQGEHTLLSKKFYVEEWLTPEIDYTITRNVCPAKVAHDHHGEEKGTTTTMGFLPI